MPWSGYAWSPAYELGLYLAMLYERRGRGEHHSVDPYINAQAAFEGPACPCVRAEALRS